VTGVYAPPPSVCRPPAGVSHTAAPPIVRARLVPLLRRLQAIHGTSGDEGRLADWLATRLARAGRGRAGQSAAPVRIVRVGDTLVAAKGIPRVALFAHLDTVGFTVGYERELIEIGSPVPRPGDRLWADPAALVDAWPTRRRTRRVAVGSAVAPVGGRRGRAAAKAVEEGAALGLRATTRSAGSAGPAGGGRGEQLEGPQDVAEVPPARVRVADGTVAADTTPVPAPIEVVVAARRDGSLGYRGPELPPGTRLAYLNPLRVERGLLRAAYLDDRLGVALAVLLFEEVADLALVLTTDEEQGLAGALRGGDIVAHELGIDQALICDVTWASAHIHPGSGPVVSLRDAFVPRQRFLDRVLAVARGTGARFQREVERSGSSDGGLLAHSHLALDWCFVGVAIRGNHSAEEEAVLGDVEAAYALYRELVAGLSRRG
jgi:putative aminopeptidase FrvX